MDNLEQDAAPVDQTRTARGRWAPGQSGNPAGRKPGARNGMSRLRDLLTEGDVETALRVLREKLAAGDGIAARFVLERLFPKPRDREIDLGLPPPEEGTTVADMLERALWLMARGEITIDEATRIARLVRQRPAVAEDASPAFDLQTAGAAPAARPSDPPLNRHERRRMAALQRAGHGPVADPPPITAAA